VDGGRGAAKKVQLLIQYREKQRGLYSRKAGGKGGTFREREKNRGNRGLITNDLAA